jgi:hypothetical protein
MNLRSEKLHENTHRTSDCQRTIIPGVDQFLVITPSCARIHERYARVPCSLTHLAVGYCLRGYGRALPLRFWPP